MILEIATLHILDGHEAAFEADLKKASHLIASIEGYVRHELKRSIEQPNRYILLVEWDSVEAHMVGFRQSQAYTEWASILTPHYEPERSMEHFEPVYSHS